MDQTLLGADIAANLRNPLSHLHADQAERARLQLFRSYKGRRVGGAPDELFRLRYEVYCLERAFLTPDPAVGDLEYDDYDDCSTHFAAFAGDDALIGTVRLVTPERERAYPFERHCTLFPGFDMPPHHACGEISRLAVRRSHRRRRADCLIGVPGAEARGLADDRRSNGSPMLLLGLYREMYRHSRANDIRFWFAAMERSLAHSLRKMGFGFQAIGPVADYYGKVTPYMLDLGAVVPQLSATNPQLGAWFNEMPLAHPRAQACAGAAMAA